MYSLIYETEITIDVEGNASEIRPHFAGTDSVVEYFTVLLIETTASDVLDFQLSCRPTVVMRTVDQRDKACTVPSPEVVLSTQFNLGGKMGPHFKFPTCKRHKQKLLHGCLITPTQLAAVVPHEYPLLTGFKIWNETIDDETQRASIQKVIVQSAPPKVRAENHHREPLAWFDGHNTGRAAQPADYGDEPYAWLHWQWGLGRHDWPQYAESISGKDAISYEEHVEEPYTRIATLEAVFAALSQRYKRADTSKVRALTIENLQNMPLNDLKSSEIFRDVTKHVEELHLLVAYQYSEIAPDHDLFHDERRQAESYIRNHWLVPMSKQLKSLTICFQNPWGLLPGYFDGRDLQFPQLKRLNLGNYTVAHDYQWDWILAQKSLASLQLDDCVIVSFIGNDLELMERWTVATDGWKQVPPAIFGFHEEVEEHYQTFFYSWNVGDNVKSDTSRIAQSELPYCLGRHFESEHFYCRYCAFEMGVAPSEWIDPEFESNTKLNFGPGPPSGHDEQEQDVDPNTELYKSLDRHKETEVEDRRALESLLETVNHRWEERGPGGLEDLAQGCRPRVA
ncbi:hypothetical protein HJFPF1_09501 [Paramyrothecium foliicola]|nr:hypothetical protein HJFPF1_09501 [Paramyrothecium foliicola]